MAERPSKAIERLGKPRARGHPLNGRLWQVDPARVSLDDEPCPRTIVTGGKVQGLVAHPLGRLQSIRARGDESARAALMALACRSLAGGKGNVSKVPPFGTFWNPVQTFQPSPGLKMPSSQQHGAQGLRMLISQHNRFVRRRSQNAKISQHLPTWPENAPQRWDGGDHCLVMASKFCVRGCFGSCLFACPTYSRDYYRVSGIPRAPVAALRESDR